MQCDYVDVRITFCSITLQHTLPGSSSDVWNSLILNFFSVPPALCDTTYYGQCGTVAKLGDSILVFKRDMKFLSWALHKPGLCIVGYTSSFPYALIKFCQKFWATVLQSSALSILPSCNFAVLFVSSADGVDQCTRSRQWKIPFTSWELSL